MTCTRSGRLLSTLAGLTLFLLLCGCMSHAPLQEKNRQLMRGGNYPAALAALEQSSLAKSDSNRLIYLLEAGHLKHLTGDYQGSNELLNAAEALAERLFTRSLSLSAASFLSNDKVIPYAGEDYESALIHYYKALNYLALGELDAAGVESRKVDEKLNYYFDSYNGKNVYKEDAFLRLLTGFIYEANGDINNAFIAYRKSLKAYRFYAEKYAVKVPALLWQRLVNTARLLSFSAEREQYQREAKAAGVEILESDTFLVVIAELGTIPAKREVSLLFPTDQGFPVKLALPAFAQDGAIPQLRITIDGKRVAAEKVENIAAIARQSLEDKKGRVLVKMIARAVAKELAAREAGKQYGLAGELALRVTSIATEQADTRLWSTLPATVEAAVIPLSAGAHRVSATAGSTRLNQAIELRQSPVEFLFLRAF